MGVRDLLGLATEIVGVVAAGAPATLLSFEAGRPVATESADTFVDGVATRTPDPLAISLICAGAARVIAVPDDAVREAMRVMHRCTHSAAEPAGALALAGALSERALLEGRRVAVINTGANADAALVASVLAG
jgi:threonine dehydratase